MTTDRSLPVALPLLPGRACTILAVTDDGTDPRYAPVRAAAARLASAAGGRVLLYLQPGPLDPRRGSARVFLPTGRGRQHTGSRQRDLLCDEAAAVGSAGVHVGIWLPPDRSTAALADAVMRTRADLVLLPAARTSPWSIDRTLEHRAAHIPAPVLAADAAGVLRAVRPLAGRRLAKPQLTVAHAILV
jgi:hypothetical protein